MKNQKTNYVSLCPLWEKALLELFGANLKLVKDFQMKLGAALMPSLSAQHATERNHGALS